MDNIHKFNNLLQNETNILTLISKMLGIIDITKYNSVG